MTEETIEAPSVDEPSPAEPSRAIARAGVVATAAFLVEVLATQLPALRGEAAWSRIGGALERSNLLVFFEIAFVLAPFGYWLVAGARTRPRARQISGVVLGLLLLFHFWELPLQRAAFGLAAEGSYTRMVEHFSRTSAGLPLISLLSIAGIGLACLHLALGLLAMGRPRALVTALGGALFVLGAASVIGLATGSTFLSPQSLPDAACGAAVEKPSR